MLYIEELGAFVCNRTPHAIHWHCGDGVITIPPEGEPLRLHERREEGGVIATIRLLSVNLPEPKWLPAPSNDNNCGQEPFLATAEPGKPCTDASGEFEYAPVLFIVSMAVAQYAATEGRLDFIAPDTSTAGAVRDSDGRIVGVRGFVRYSL